VFILKVCSVISTNINFDLDKAITMMKSYFHSLKSDKTMSIVLLLFKTGSKYIRYLMNSNDKEFLDTSTLMETLQFKATWMNSFYLKLLDPGKCNLHIIFVKHIPELFWSLQISQMTTSLNQKSFEQKVDYLLWLIIIKAILLLYGDRLRINLE